MRERCSAWLDAGWETRAVAKRGASVVIISYDVIYYTAISTLERERISQARTAVDRERMGEVNRQGGLQSLSGIREN